MYYEIEQALQCPSCKADIGDVIKMIPDCGYSICAHCYEVLKTTIEEKNSAEFKCPACSQTHEMPKGGLIDNRLGQNVHKACKNSLSNQVKNLEAKICDVRCDQLHLEVSDAVQHIEIQEYRQKCFETIAKRPMCIFNDVPDQLAKLTVESLKGNPKTLCFGRKIRLAKRL